MLYLNYPSMGVPDSDSLKKISSFIEKLPVNIKGAAEDYAIELVQCVEDVREKIAEIYGVSSKNIAFINNTTEGLGLIASAMKSSGIKTNVLVPDIEFISSSLVWSGHANQIDFVVTKDGKVDPTGIYRELTKGANNILSMSSVQEVSGYRFSFQDLLDGYQKKENEFWIIDGIQEAGVLWRDMKQDQIDAYIVGGHKWLNSPFGLGFMYMSDRLLQVIEPPFKGYFNLEEPDGGWVAYLESRNHQRSQLLDQPLQDGACVFEPGGMVNAIGAMMIGEAMDNWEKFGISNAENHVLELRELFQQRVHLGNEFRLMPKNEKNWSSILTITSLLGVEFERILAENLAKRGFKVSLRSVESIGGVRFGFHYTTTKKDVEYFATELNSILAGIREMALPKH